MPLYSWKASPVRRLKIAVSYPLWRLAARIQYWLIGNCGLNCGYATFKKLDGKSVTLFVPEADCPVHDIV